MGRSIVRNSSPGFVTMGVNPAQQVFHFQVSVQLAGAGGHCAALRTMAGGHCSGVDVSWKEP